MRHFKLTASSNVDVRFVLDVVAFCLVMWLGMVALNVGLQDQLRIVDIATKLATFTALVTGGVWSYNRFVRERVHRPALNLDYELNAFRISDEQWLLKVFVKITNVGKILITLRKWRIRAEQLLPCDENTREFLVKHTAFTERQSPWLTVAGEPEEYLPENEFSSIRLEPGEIDFAMANLVVPASADIVQLYSEFKENSDGEATWVRQYVVDLKKLRKETSDELQATTRRPAG